MTRKCCVSTCLLLLLLLTGCRPAAAPTTTGPPAADTGSAVPLATSSSPPIIAAPTAANTPAPPTETPQQPTDTAAPPSATPTPGLPPLPAEAQRIEFAAEDDAALVGYYYPAAVNPAPIIVLMHWAGGDQTDWLYVGMVSWLQNRGAEIPAPPETKYFDTPYPFSPLPEGQSFAVFTFDFRGYGESAGGGGQDKLILDAAAALPGVDPVRVAGIGASIGADGVVDGCNEACIAALSLGPGNWLEMSYPEAVKVMGDLGKPVWCVAAEDDETADTTCRAATGDHYQVQIYPSGGHAMRLFHTENDLQPSIEVVILDYLRLVFNLPQK